MSLETKKEKMMEASGPSPSPPKGPLQSRGRKVVPRLDSTGRVTALTRGSLARAGTTQVFTEGAVFYNLKELVRAPVRASSAPAPPSCHLRSLAVVQAAICSKQKGIVLQSVKDVLTDLLSDDMVTQDKVGTQTL